MLRTIWIPILASLLLSLPARAFSQTTTSAAPADSHPNVLLIIIDDVAPNVNSVNGNPTPCPTPNIARLAARGTWFSHAYNAAPSCCPSRTAILTGIHPARSGVYYNTQDYKKDGPDWMKSVETLPARFLRAGYLTASYGKLYHTAYQASHEAEFTPGYFKKHNARTDVANTDATLNQQILPNTLHEIPGNSSKNWTWGILPNTFDSAQPAADPALLQQDTQQANRTIDLISTKHNEPFFVACGFWRPHVAWTVPQRYYDRFPLPSIHLPEGYKEDDLADLPKPGQWIALHTGHHQDIVAAGMWEQCLQSYYASLTYVDEQIGRLLDALDHSPNADNTLIVFLSDNGLHLGEKNHWLKYALWEQTCQTFFAIAGPNLPKAQTLTPAVGLIDIYPTLMSLCHLSPPTTHTLDGTDLTPLLTGHANDRGSPVLQTYGQSNHAVSDARYRYIRYRNGAEELYDHTTDPHEFTNLLPPNTKPSPTLQPILTRLSQSLPTQNAPGIPEFNNGKGDNSRWLDEAFN